MFTSCLETDVKKTRFPQQSEAAVIPWVFPSADFVPKAVWEGDTSVGTWQKPTLTFSIGG